MPVATPGIREQGGEERFPWEVKLPPPSGVGARGCRGGEEISEPFASAQGKQRPHPFPPEAGERMGQPKSFSEFKATPPARQETSKTAPFVNQNQRMQHPKSFSLLLCRPPARGSGIRPDAAPGCACLHCGPTGFGQRCLPQRRPELLLIRQRRDGCCRAPSDSRLHPVHRHRRPGLLRGIGLRALA